MKKIILLQAALAASALSHACPVCNQNIRNAIYNSSFYPNLFMMLSAFIALAIIVVVLTVLSTRRHKGQLNKYSGASFPSPVPLTTASLVTGIGLGGFVDGIVLHQILQVHEMLSNKMAATNYIGKSVNMFWDGIFHFFCLLVVITGIVLLWKLTGRKNIDLSGRLFAAGLIGGWGLFNLVEGIIDHQWLKLHNVVEFAANHNWGNYFFLGISVLMLLVSYGLMRSETKRRYNAA